MVMGPAVIGTKNYFTGEDQQQFTRPFEVSQSKVRVGR
jgi:hypothetical protein